MGSMKLVSKRSFVETYTMTLMPLYFVANKKQEMKESTTEEPSIENTKMYVTRPLSIYTKSPEAALLPPPEGPNSGYLVFTDKEYEAEATHFFGLCKDNKIRNLPFPQNKILRIHYSSNSETVYRDKAYFIPVLDQPLSSNRYYVILADGKYKGNACTCSREEDMVPCCFGNSVNDVKPRALDHTDMYQQVEIIRRRGGCFVAKSIAPDGIPPLFLRRKGWEVYTKTPHDFQLGEAHGVDLSLRARLPAFDFPISNKHSRSVVVGKWYIPFMFIKEHGTSSKDQMKKSMFYEMYLEQMWDEIHMCENHGTEQNAVVVKTIVRREMATILGMEAVARVVDRVMWLSGPPNSMGVGLRMAVVDRMKWEACRGGWIDGNERELKVESVEEFGGVNGWRKFGCYMLVERFVLRRMDGSLVLTYDFNHSHLIQSKWE